ncbi:hypothetical protein JCM5353_001202 [Sporobolomyces roseus]
MPSSKLTRSLSRPFTDLSNLLRSPSMKSTTRPELSNLTTLKKRHSLTRKTRKKKSSSSTPTPPPFTFHESFSPSHSHEDLASSQLDIDQIQFESLSPSPSPSPIPISQPPTQEQQDEYEHLLDSLPYATSRRQWKECSPVLEDPELEAIETSFFTAKAHLPSLREKESRERWIGDTTSIEGEGDADVEESFVTAREEGGMRESPVKLSRKGLILPQLRTEEEEEEGEEEGKEYRSTMPQDSPTSLTSSTTQNEGSYVVDTPDTSFPSSPGHEEPCDEPEWLVKTSSTPSKSTAFAQIQQGRKFTPPRFVEVVETCPTPEGQNAEKGRVEMESPVRRRSEVIEQDQYRRRSLLRSSELDFDRESIEELEFDEDEEGELATRYLSNYSTGGSEPRSSRVHYTSPTPSTLHLHRSYAPSIISEVAEEESLLSQSRPQSRNHSRNSTSSPSIFPTVSASELVMSSLLSSSQLTSRPTTSSQFNPYSSLSHRAPPTPLKNTRPLSASYSKPLRPKQSEVSLFTYDLSHLPAPSTPLERPYRVNWRDLIKPSASLGGGRGSGRFGDLSGAVERKPTAVRRGESEVRTGERVDTPIPRLGRAASVRRSLSRWTGLDSILDVNEGDEEEGAERPLSRAGDGERETKRKRGGGRRRDWING